MSDMGIKYDQDIATKGMSEGKVEVLENLHDPGRQGTEDAQKAHAHATTSEEDRPVEINAGRHMHHRTQE